MARKSNFFLRFFEEDRAEADEPVSRPTGLVRGCLSTTVTNTTRAHSTGRAIGHARKAGRPSRAPSSDVAALFGLAPAHSVVLVALVSLHEAR